MSIIDPGDLTIATKMYNDHVATKGVAEYNCNVSYTHKQGHEVRRNDAHLLSDTHESKKPMMFVPEKHGMEQSWMYVVGVDIH